jgi:hypothetical protein
MEKTIPPALVYEIARRFAHQNRDANAEGARLGYYLPELDDDAWIFTGDASLLDFVEAIVLRVTG